ncbi:MAG: putative Fe-S protein YdhL (DUF1289 family) [Paraglaciecola sp.]|jgi:predicted Fe-S protein YdhL (DUF1289 family)
MYKAQQPDIPSPCVRNCCLDDKDVCLGCLRTLEEILMWGEADNFKRQQILDNCSARNNQNKSN